MKGKAEKKTRRKVAGREAASPPDGVAAVKDVSDFRELTGVPFLGPVRAQALAAAGLTTIAELRAASPEQIGGVKGVGLRNAQRIKEWLDTQSASSESASENGAEGHAVLPTEIGGAVSRIKEANPKKSLDKLLSRQLDKVLNRVAEVPATLESLGLKEKQQASKALDRIALLLAATADRGRLSDKKQHTVGGAIKARLRKLEKALED